MHTFQKPNEQNHNRYCYDGFMDAINVASFLIGLQNLDLNVTANDINDQTEMILKDLHTYLEKQETHLLEQDRHLTEQDKRISRLEEYIRDIMARKER